MYWRLCHCLNDMFYTYGESTFLHSGSIAKQNGSHVPVICWTPFWRCKTLCGTYFGFGYLRWSQPKENSKRESVGLVRLRPGPGEVELSALVPCVPRPTSYGYTVRASIMVGREKKGESVNDCLVNCQLEAGEYAFAAFPFAELLLRSLWLAAHDLPLYPPHLLKATMEFSPPASGLYHCRCSKAGQPMEIRSDNPCLAGKTF
jgi:hypothetical protein